MALERRNPLPVGLYAIDVLKKNEPAFLQWRTDNKAVAKIRKTSTDAESGIVWVLFQTLGPTTKWPNIGFPDIAAKGLATERVPSFEPTPDLTDQIAPHLPSPAGFTGFLWAAAIVGGIYAAAQLIRAVKE